MTDYFWMVLHGINHRGNAFKAFFIILIYLIHLINFI